MRSYKKLKKYNGGKPSINNKGLLIVHVSSASSTTQNTIDCTIQNPDGTTSVMSILLFPVLDSSSGLPFAVPAGNCWSIIPFNVVALAGGTSAANIYELF
jgi:hypothetical protein